MKRTRKLILALVVVMSLLMAMAVAFIPASAANEQPEYLYFKANSNWKSDGARFAAYFFGNGDRWVSMTSIGNDYYVVKVPTDKTFPSVIFVRMNGSNNSNGWNNKWNQTGDLTIPTNGRNTFNAPSTCYDGYTGGWQTSAYTPTFTVAGTFNGWAAEADDTNKMTYTENGIWKITIQIDNGDHKYKVASGSWTASWPGSDKAFSTTYTKSNVTFTFDMNTTTVTETVVCAHGGKTTTTTVNATCTVNGSTTVTCDECSETISKETITAPGHSATCGHSVANVGGVYYESIKDAIDNAESGTITLVDDVTYEGTLAITNENIVIDLNGNNLVADGIVTFGYGVQIVDSGETKGLIDVDREKLVFAPLVDEETGEETSATSTEIVPVWNGEGYVIADVTDRYVQPEVEGKADNSFIIDFKPKFDGVAHSYVKGGEIATGLTFEVRITGGDFDKTYTVEDSLIAEAYNGKSVRLNLINAQEGVTYTVQLIIKSECGLNYVGELGQYTYTVPVDAE